MTQDILVVDDSRTVRTVVEWVFHGSPYSVRAASTASDAMRAIREHQPVAVIVDYSLPDQSGFELCQEIRRNPDLKQLPVLMFGGTWGGFDESRVSACGADDFIYKPFKTDALIEKVTSVISRASQRPMRLTPVGEAIVAPPRQVPPIPGPQGPDPAALTPAFAESSDPQAESSGFRRVAKGLEVEPGPPPLPSAGAFRASQPTPDAPALERDPAPSPLSTEAAPTPVPEPVEELSAEEPTAEVTAADEPTAPVAGLAPLPSVRPLAPPPIDEDDGEELEEIEEDDGDESPEALVAAGRLEIDPVELEALVRQLLPPIVKDVLAALLRQTIGARVEGYATNKINAFIENELPAMAEKAIEERLADLTGEG